MTEGLNWVPTESVGKTKRTLKQIVKRYIMAGQETYPRSEPRYDVIWTLNKRGTAEYNPPFERKVVMDGDWLEQIKVSSVSLGWRLVLYRRDT